MFTIDGDGLPIPQIRGNSVAATRVPIMVADTFETVHQRYAELRASAFGVDASTFGIRVRTESAPKSDQLARRRYVVTHTHADGGAEHVIHERFYEERPWQAGRKAAIGPNLRSAFDNRMWRLRQAQARLNAMTAAGAISGRPIWSVVADEIVQRVLEATRVDLERMLDAIRQGEFATAEMPVKRRRTEDPKRGRHRLVDDADVRETLPAMRGSLDAGVLQIERMDLGRGATYDGHPSGAQITVPMAGQVPETLIEGMRGMEFGRVVEHPMVPGHLVITAVRRNEHTLQLTVHAPKLPLRLPPEGIGYDVTLR